LKCTNFWISLVHCCCKWWFHCFIWKKIHVNWINSLTKT
jgi:hypothetical protein